MAKYRFVVALLLIMMVADYCSAGTYLGNKMLEILGESRAGSAFSEFKTQYLLDKSLKNTELGIKLSASHDSAALVTAIMLTGPACEVNEVKYKQFDGAMPFNISFNDDAESLGLKLGEGRNSDDNRVKYKKDGITINVFFKSPTKKKIAYVKFTQNIGLEGPYRLDGDHQVHPVMLASAGESLSVIDATRNQIVTGKPSSKPVNRNVNALPGAAEFGKNNANASHTSEDPFYLAIMHVIESGEEEMFKDIKREALAKTNFWNYKYTYSTTVAIPGEKYNMLYSYPFQSSQLDFVSVLEESDGDNSNIASKYGEIEGKLKEYFKLTEGWTYHYIVNQEDPKGIKDFELKNPKLGSIVLDYSTNPYGKHVLYLRFLLQYT